MPFPDPYPNISDTAVTNGANLTVGTTFSVGRPFATGPGGVIFFWVYAPSGRSLSSVRLENFAASISVPFDSVEVVGAADGRELWVCQYATPDGLPLSATYTNIRGTLSGTTGSTVRWGRAEMPSHSAAYREVANVADQDWPTQVVLDGLEDAPVLSIIGLDTFQNSSNWQVMNGATAATPSSDPNYVRVGSAINTDPALGSHVSQSSSGYTFHVNDAAGDTVISSILSVWAPIEEVPAGPPPGWSVVWGPHAAWTAPPDLGES
jgi:hypothetical protein